MYQKQCGVFKHACIMKWWFGGVASYHLATPVWVPFDIVLRFFWTFSIKTVHLVYIIRLCLFYQSWYHSNHAIPDSILIPPYYSNMYYLIKWKEWFQHCGINCNHTGTSTGLNEWNIFITHCVHRTCLSGNLRINIIIHTGLLLYTTVTLLNSYWSVYLLV